MSSAPRTRAPGSEPHEQGAARRVLDLRGAALASLCAAALSTGCSTLSHELTTETSGTFRATGLAFTIFSIDLPKGSLLIARENASDANLANMEVTETVTFPYLGPFDWILDILSFRWSKVEGTWGYAPPPG